MTNDHDVFEELKEESTDLKMPALLQFPLDDICLRIMSLNSVPGIRQMRQSN